MVDRSRDYRRSMEAFGIPPLPSRLSSVFSTTTGTGSLPRPTHRCGFVFPPPWSRGGRIWPLSQVRAQCKDGDDGEDLEEMYRIVMEEDAEWYRTFVTESLDLGKDAAVLADVGVEEDDGGGYRGVCDEREEEDER